MERWCYARGGVWFEVGGEVRGEAGPGDHVGGHDHAEREDRRRGRGVVGGLVVQLLAAGADGDDDGDGGGDPGIALVGVQHGEAAEGDAEGQHSRDDDADRHAQVAVGDGRETLPADDGLDDAEADQGREVEQDRDRDEVAAVAFVSGVGTRGDNGKRTRSCTVPAASVASQSWAPACTDMPGGGWSRG